MEIAAESGLGTALLGNLMVANRPLATPAVLAIPNFAAALTTVGAKNVVADRFRLKPSRDNTDSDGLRNYRHVVYF
jgi:hypothetical protein